MKISDKSINHFLSNKVIDNSQFIEQKEEKILCNHCMRTASNGIRCMGICVADNDYWLINLIFYRSFAPIIIKVGTERLKENDYLADLIRIR